MIANVQLYLLWLLAAASMYWLTANTYSKARGFVAVASSIVLVTAVAPIAALLAGYIAVAVIVWLRYFAARGPGRWVWVAVASLLLPLVLLRLESEPRLVVTLGIGFLTLKALATFIDGYHAKRAPSPESVFLQTFFVPSYSAGPVEPIESFERGELATTIDLDTVVQALGRIALGLFKSLYLAEVVIKGLRDASWLEGSAVAPSRLDALLLIMVSFAYTYTNFSAYMDIAIGSGRLLGVRLMENFNYPFLARSLSEFWQRWHISLGDWAMKYLYFPTLVRFTRPAIPFVAIAVTFLLVGMWHELTINYVVWGLGHGLGLACTLWARKRLRASSMLSSQFGSTALTVLGIPLTLFYVALLQTLANLDGLDPMLRLMEVLVWS